VKSSLLTLVVLMLATTALTAQTANIEEVNKSPVSAKFAAAGKIRMDICPGGVNIVGVGDDQIRVAYDSNRYGTNVKVRIHVSGDHADLIVSRCPHHNFEFSVEVPRSSDLYVRMLAGDLNVKGITGNKDVELHFGQLTIDAGEPNQYSHVDGSVMSGDLEAPPFDVSKGGLFRSFEHTGTGQYRLHAHVGAGELDLN
jgi:hypothetical protein